MAMSDFERDEREAREAARFRAELRDFKPRTLTPPFQTADGRFVQPPRPQDHAARSSEGQEAPH